MSEEEVMRRGRREMSVSYIAIEVKANRQGHCAGRPDSGVTAKGMYCNYLPTTLRVQLSLKKEGKRRELQGSAASLILVGRGMLRGAMEAVAPGGAIWE